MPSSLPPEIARFYEATAEEERLSVGPSQLEFVRTKEIALRHLPPPPATILDVGGAAGAYSFWLAESGYTVHLIDAVPRHVELALQRNESAAIRIETAAVGDARSLPFPDESVHAVLTMGPLYHLTEASDRRNALREAFRVLRPGGILFGAAISRCASVLDGIARDLFADPAFAPIVRQDIEHGRHTNATDNLDYFTTAYFHRPDDFQNEVVQAGFRCQGVFGLEGPGWILADFAERWSDPRRREDLLRVARDLETEASIIGLSAHLLAVGVRP